MGESLEKLFLMDQRGDLNELMSYHLETPHHLAVHLQHKDDIPLTEKIRLVQEGMRTLASKIEAEVTLRNVEDVYAMSWAVTKFRPLFEGMGFRIDDTHEHPLWQRERQRWSRLMITQPRLHPYSDVEPSLAVIQRDEFLDRFGKSVRPPGLEPGTPEV